ncbi:NAD(P)H-dependent oxidoreductase [Streptomyces europaeiscabiei]|uniref:NAD(P)H-dependent oxidoreductase n=1 Tax=Streptomyces europaeiscabiei TaxID=146819 RepID=UPI0038F78A97
MTLGWAFTMDGSASKLADKKAVVAVTTGVPADHYTPEGSNKATVETLLSNWHATLRLCQFDIQQPMVKVHGTAFGLSDEDLANLRQAVQRTARLLRRLTRSHHCGRLPSR